METENKSVKGGRLRAAAVIFVACVCGWFVMELEVLGIRMLSPYFGSAVYVVMGSVIGIFLLCLSIGYMVGGWLSRKGGSVRTMGVNLMVAGAWLIGLPFIVGPVCDGIYDLGLDEKFGSLLASLALFGVPTVLLGTVSPTAVRWLTKEAGDSGLNTGLVLAFSTMASFAGSVVTAFYLVVLSLQRTMRISGAILAGLGAIMVLQAILHSRSDGDKKTVKCNN